MNAVETLLTNEVEKSKTPSVQYLFFGRDGVIQAFRNGLADIKNNRRVDEHTTYHAFSVTKTFTALAVLQLAEQGILNVEDPIAKHLPSFPYPSEITIRQLLTHTSGIPNPVPLNWIHTVGENVSFDRNQFFDQIMKKHSKTRFQPNMRFHYSNLGYVILGQMIERTQGMSYEHYVTENILQKLDVKPHEIGFRIPAAPVNPKGYHKRISVSGLVLGLLLNTGKYMQEAEGMWRLFRDFYVNGVAYGGLIGTPLAFGRYIQELLTPSCVLLSEAYKKMLFTENRTRDGKPTGMCLSWFKGQLNRVDYFAHAGGGGGYYCEIRIYPSLGVGSVIMFNRTGMRDERFLDRLDCYHI